jgi:hypothetical protein
MKTITEIATELVNCHYLEDPELFKAFLFYDDKVIRIAEVTDLFLGTCCKMLPYKYPPRPDMQIPHAVELLLFSREEWKEVESGKEELPFEWLFSPIIELPIATHNLWQ